MPISGARETARTKVPPLHSAGFTVDWPLELCVFTRELTLMAKLVDITGQRFGHLIVIGLVKRGHVRDWQCQCDCGKIVLKKSKLLTQKGHITCGDKKKCPYLRALQFGGNRLPIRHRLTDLASEEELRTKIKEPCEYCGLLFNNGLGEGPGPTTLVTVCGKCRQLRQKTSHLEFLRLVKAIAKHQGWAE